MSSSNNERKRQVVGEEQGNRQKRRKSAQAAGPLARSITPSSCRSARIGKVVVCNEEQGNSLNDGGTPEKKLGTLIQKLLVTDGKATVLSALNTLLGNQDHYVGNDETGVNQGFLSTGGALAVVQSMKNYPTSAVVQLRGCRLLNLLAYGNNEGRAPIVELNGMQVVLEAMELFTNHEAIQEFACAIVGNLSKGVTSKEHILKHHQERAITLMLAAMQKFPNHCVIQKAGCIFLRQLAEHSQDAKELIRNKHGVTIVAKSFELHPYIREFTKKTLNVLVA